MKIYHLQIIRCSKCDSQEFAFTDLKFSYTCNMCGQTIIIATKHVTDEDISQPQEYNPNPNV